MDQSRYSVALTAALGLLMGLPVWWKTTEVHRATLPKVDVSQETAYDVQVAFEVVHLSRTSGCLFGKNASSVFQTLKLFDEDFESREKSFRKADKVRKTDERVEKDITVSLICVTSKSCSQYSQSSKIPCKMRWETPQQAWTKLNAHEQDEMLLRLMATEGTRSTYRLLLVDKEGHASERSEGTSGLPDAVIGKHRHAWISSKSPDKFHKLNISELVRIGRHMYLGGSRPSTTREQRSEGKQTSSNKTPKRGRARRRNGPLPLASDGSALLSFTLLNANPADWVIDWDFTAAEQQFLAPLKQTISPVADVTVESQVLHYARGQVRPTWDPRHQAYTLSSSSLPFFVNSNEWHLDTSIAATGRSKILHLVVYVPAADECPLHFTLPSGKLSATDGFTVPSWGGVVVWSPANCSRTDPATASPRMIPPGDMERILAVQIGQIRSLFGLPAAPKRLEGVHVLSPGANGFADWEVAALLRQQAVDDSQEALSTLRSLSKLVSELSNMVVQDSISDGMRGALRAAESARAAFVNGSYELAARAARQARAQAESAFFHPTLMSLLYFPSEHHLAVYMPLFLPVLVNVCAAVFRETISWGRARSRRKLCEALRRAKREAPLVPGMTSAKSR